MSNEVKMTSLVGGGDSWMYLILNGKIADSSHKDDMKGMHRLHTTVKQQKGVDKRGNDICVTNHINTS